MKIILIIAVLVAHAFQNAAAAQQLSDEQDSMINSFNELRYNYPDSALNLVEDKLMEIDNSSSTFYAELLFLKAAIHYVQSNYLESRNTYEDLFTLSQEINDTKGIARALNGRGLIYLGRKLYNAALQEFKMALKVNREIDNQKNIAANLLNIGICYQELEKWDSAYSSYQESCKISQQNSFEVYSLMNLNRIGTLFVESNQLDSAESYLLKVYQSDPNQWEKSFNLSSLSALEFKKEKYRKAVEYGLESFKIAEEIRAKWDASEAALKLSKAYEEMELFDQALLYHKLHQAYSDSLLNEEMNREINWAELQKAKIENEQLKTQKNLLSTIKERNQLIIFLLSAVVIFLIILALLYHRHIKQKDKYNQNLGTINRQLADKKLQIEEQNINLIKINQAKNRLFSILSHDLRSPINSVKQLLDIRNSISEKDVEKFMERLTREVGQVNEQINVLLKWANTQMDGFKTNPKTLDLDQIVTQNMNSIRYIAEEKDITLKHNPTNSFVYMDGEQLNIIINNLLNNALKYTASGGVIKVTSSENGKSTYLTIEDNGIGMDQETVANLEGEIMERSYSRKGTDQEVGTGLGLLLVKQFLTFNHASMSITSEEGKGTRFVLTLPKVSVN